MSRERPPPRGPKVMHEPPSGPRAGYGNEFRGGARSRGRGRGFRDDSRDRGRDLERDRGFARDYNHRDDRGGRFRDDRSRERDLERDRDYRNNAPDRRDTRGRGGGGNFHRGDRSRDREWRDREPFHNRNPSPQLRRSRSPDLRSSRDSRDRHLNLDLDRTHRGPRDGPLSAGSSSSDPSAIASSQHNRGGYGRGRGFARGDWEHRGGGRARYQEDRFRARSRSQERDNRELLRGRGDLLINRDDRGHRDERGPDPSRTTNERKLSSWDSPLPSVRGHSPSSAKDDSRHEEGEIKREPRADNAARRKPIPDFGSRGGTISNDRFAARPTSQSPPSVTLVPAFGSVTGRPPPPAPPITSQASAIRRPTPVPSAPAAILSAPTTERAPINSPAPALLSGRAPPTAPKADRSKSIAESAISPNKDSRSSIRGSSMNTFPPFSNRKESQDALNSSNLETNQARFTGASTTISRAASLQLLDRIPLATQTLAGQKHARSDSEPDLSSGSLVNKTMPAPIIPTGPRADREKNASSPSNATKMRYALAQKVPNAEAVPSRSRDSRNMDLGQSQPTSTNSIKQPSSSGSTPTVESRNLDLLAFEARTSPKRKRSLQQELLELRAKKRIKKYAPALKTSKVVDQNLNRSGDSPVHNYTESSASQPLLLFQPLELDTGISYDDNASDSDSGDEDELDEDYFEAQNRKLTAELAEVEKILRPQEQLFPPCDLTVDDLAFAEIHDSDIIIIPELSSKQSSLAPIPKESPPPTVNTSPSPVTVQALAPKPETVDVPMTLPEALIPAVPSTVTLPSEGNGIPAATEIVTAQPELPIQSTTGRRTPSPSRLTIIPDASPFHKDSLWLKSIVQIPERQKEGLKEKMRIAKHLEQEIIRREKSEYISKYKIYLQMAASLEAEKPRKQLSKADLVAAKDLKRAPAAVLSIEIRPEGGRSTRNSHQSQLELEAVLRASEQEAQDLKKKFDNKAQSKPNYAIEAEIPDQLTNRTREQTRYLDKTGLVPFHDAVDVFGFGEFRTDFTPEERKIFEKAYKKTPKQWGIIAESLENRDFHDCIAHYYAVKGDASWPFKVRKVKTAKTRAGKPRPRTLVADSRDPDDDQNDKLGRRVTRAAAAENIPSESENNTPVPASGKRAPTPIKTVPTPVKGRALTPAPPKKTLVSSKLDPNVPANPPERKSRKTAARTTSTKKAKNIQAATAVQASNLPGQEDLGNKSDARRPKGGVPIEHNRFASGFEVPADLSSNAFPDFVSREQSGPSTPFTMGMTSQAYPSHDNMVMAQQPPAFDGQPQDRRGLQATSSYWSVPEQNDFPGLLKAFGMDWGSIAEHMTSKTHIMVFTTKFRKWLTVPLGLEHSRLVANVQEQVKNYYQRQIEQGKVELEQIAQEAEAKKAQGKKLDLPPAPSVPPKRPYNSSATQQIAAVGLDVFEDLSPKIQSGTARTASPAQTSLSSRFPAIAQAGPVPQNTSETNHASSVPQIHAPYSQPPQQIQQRPFASPRGPLSSFMNERERPILSASATPKPQPFVSTPEQSSMMAAQAAQAAHEAEIEKREALRIEKEQERQRQERDRRDRQSQSQQPQTQPQSQLQPNQERRDQERVQIQERQLRMKQEIINEHQNLHLYEQYSSHSQQPGLTAPSRVESRITSPALDTRRGPQPQSQPFGSRNHVRNIIGVSSVPTSPHNSHASPNPANTRTPLGVSTNLLPQQYASPATPVQPPAAPSRPPEPVRSSVSIMSLLNDEPSDPYPAPSSKRVNEVASNAVPRSHSPNHQQQPYQPSRPQSTQSSLRREPSLSDVHNSSQSYTSNNPGSTQGAVRHVDSPYSATTQSRSQMASPMDSSPATEREYFSRQPYSLPTQQLPGPSPQSGSSYQNQLGHQSNHRLHAFAPQSQRTASPPNGQYQAQMHLATSRNNSFDSRQGPPAFASGHQHQGSPMPIHQHHAHQHPLQNARFGGPQPGPPQIQHLSHSRTPSHYGQSSPHSMQQAAQSAGPMRSFTPSAYDSRSYSLSSPGPSVQQQPLSHEQQQSMLRRQMHQQQDAALRQEQLRQHEAGYDNGYVRYEQQLYDDRRDERRMDDSRR